MKNWILVSLISLLFTTNIHGQYFELSGKAEQFSKDSLILKTVVNPITGEYLVLDTLIFESDGSFNQKISAAHPMWVFINTGVFRIYIYTVPGKGYEIALPPKTEKTEADIRNPFFKPMIAHIQVLREYSVEHQHEIYGNDINNKIFRFDTLIASRNNEMREARRRMEPYNSDSLIVTIESNYKDDTSDYFKRYRDYRYGIIKINSRDTGLEEIYKNYLYSSPPEISNPAYMDLFNEMYREFIFYYSRTEGGRGVSYAINRVQDPDSLKTILMNHPAIPDARLAELVIIKEIYDVYFKDIYYREALLMLLDTLKAEAEWSKNRELAAGVKNYLIKLKVGQAPPEFNLLDRNKISRSPEDYKGKYLYLNFCTPDNYSCLMEFPFLKILNEKHKDYLQIVTVMVSNSHENMVDFMTKNNYSWPALFYNKDEKLLWNYDIRAFPTNYLIGPDGTLIQSPATLATEGFEQQLFRIMRSRGDL